jgi:hypothetical protein
MFANTTDHSRLRESLETVRALSPRILRDQGLHENVGPDLGNRRIVGNFTRRLCLQTGVSLVFVYSQIK